ncbi:MAG: HAD hydrolase family protein [Deltaproteobacteria bacterium]|nr:HAD hydrolase family protein [Deltaproteobacteria bacterium]
MYELLAVDVDGTLVRRGGGIDPRDRRAIAALQARGVPVALATGRLYSGSVAVLDALCLRGPQVCVNGAEIVVHPEATELVHLGIVGEASAAVRSALGRHDFAVFALAEGHVVSDERGAMFEGYVRAWSHQLDKVARSLDHPCWDTARGPLGVVAIGLTEPIVEATAELRRCAGLDVFRFDVSAHVGVSCILLHAARVSKGTGLAWLAEHYGLSLDQVVAVGDWHNDLSMFAVAGRSFAMAGGPDEVGRAATDRLTTPSTAGGGVAEAIQRAWPELQAD